MGLNFVGKDKTVRPQYGALIEFLLRSSLAGFTFFGLTLITVFLGISIVLLFGDASQIFQSRFPELVPYLQVVDNTFPRSITSYLILPMIVLLLWTTWVFLHQLDFTMESLWGKVKSKTTLETIGSYWFLTTIVALPLYGIMVFSHLLLLGTHDTQSVITGKVLEFLIVGGTFALSFWLFSGKFLTRATLGKAAAVGSAAFNINSTIFLSYLTMGTIQSGENLMISGFFGLVWSVTSIIIYVYTGKYALSLQEQADDLVNTFTFRDLNLLCLVEMAKRAITFSRDEREHSYFTAPEFAEIHSVSLREARQVMNYLQRSRVITIAQCDDFDVTLLNVSPDHFTIRDFLSVMDGGRDIVDSNSLEQTASAQFWSQYAELLDVNYLGITLRDLAESDIEREAEGVIGGESAAPVAAAPIPPAAPIAAAPVAATPTPELASVTPAPVTTSAPQLVPTPVHQEVAEAPVIPTIPESEQTMESLLDRIRNAS
jgi:hypothetical protein